VLTALDKIKEITEFLKNAGIEDAHKESEIILTHSLCMDKTVLYRDNPTLSEKDILGIDKIIERRAEREPLQYIIGYIDFYGLRIKVGQGVLIPRPETELLVEEAIKAISHQLSAISKKKSSSCCRLTAEGYKLNILDLCTGSGCLALAIAKHFPDATVYGTDISEEAIKYAQENAEINGIKNAIFLVGSLFEPIEKLTPHPSSLISFDIIVSNPPYIKSSDIAYLQPEIRGWEPLTALDGGEDGLRYYREILSNAKKYLVEGGVIILEIGEGQAGHVSEIVKDNGLKNISFIKDYAGIDRIVSISC
jgi:release factor glutamine methyltransferase